MKLSFIAVAASMLVGAVSAQAAPFTFAQFDQKDMPDTIQVTNGTGSTGSLMDIGDPIVSFSFLLPSLQAVGLGTQDARMNLTGVITTPASIMVQTGPDPINQMVDSGTLSFTRLTAAPEGTGRGTRTNLLTITFTNALISGSVNGTAGSFFASTEDSQIVFTSDFLDFREAASLDFALAFSSITGGGLNRKNGSATESLRAFMADSTGTFSSDPRPTYVNEIPEPAMIGLMGLGLLVVGWRRRTA